MLSMSVKLLIGVASFFFVLHVNEAGLLKERLLSRSKIGDVYNRNRFDAQRFDEWPNKSPDRVQTKVQRKKDNHDDKFSSSELSRRQQCRYGACGKRTVHENPNIYDVPWI